MFTDIEEKARFVRTAAGARRYNLPIGALITGVGVPDLPTLRSRTASPTRATPRGGAAATQDAITRTPEGNDLADRILKIRRTGKHKKLTRSPKEYEGFKTWAYGREKFHIGRHEGKWVATDDDFNVLTEGDKEGEVFIDLSDILGIPLTTSDAVAAAEKARLSTLTDEPTPENMAKFKEIHGATVPPGLHDIRITLDPNAETIASGIGPEGTRKWIKASRHVAEGQDRKYERVRRLRESGDWDKIEREALTYGVEDDTAAAVLLMLRTGIRVASRDEQVGAVDQAYGATTLRGKHVTINQQSVRLRFIGKEQVQQDYTIKDPDIVELFTARAHVKGNARVFPETDSKKTIEFIRKATGGGEYINHDLRTAVACEMALDLVAKWKRRPPKTAKEYKAKKKEVAIAVSNQLGNKPEQAISSYIDPGVWEPWKSQFEGAKK